MLYYPQLETGAVTHFPLRRALGYRSFISKLPDGSTIKLNDYGAGLIEWELFYSALSDAEVSLLEDLFIAAEGRLRTFTFLDPSSNLLRWSSDLGEPVWQADGLLQVDTAAADPWGLESGSSLVNAGQVAQTILQRIPAPGTYAYCFSLYAQAFSDTDMTLKISAPGSEIVTSHRVQGLWRRYLCAGSLTGADGEVDFSITLPAGASIQVAGLQAEPQPGSSPFRKTEAVAGVYQRTRFAEDRFSVRADGLNAHSLQVRLVSKLEA